MDETNEKWEGVQPTPFRIRKSDEPEVYEIKSGTLTSTLRLIAAISFDGYKQGGDGKLKRAFYQYVEPPMEDGTLDYIAEKLNAIEIENEAVTRFILNPEATENGIRWSHFVVKDDAWKEEYEDIDEDDI